MSGNKIENTVSACFFCKNALDKTITVNEDTKLIIHDYTPCQSCKEQMDKGITLIGVTNEPTIENQLPITVFEEMPYYPSGDLMVVDEKMLDKIYTDEKQIEEIKLRKGVFVTVDTIKNIELMSKLKDSELK